jgi:hypothetical protein
MAKSTKTELKHNVISHESTGKETYNNVIVNAIDLDRNELIGQRVRCPCCDKYVFDKWPSGWDSHAEKKCAGLGSTRSKARLKEFRSRFGHLFGTKKLDTLITSKKKKNPLKGHKKDRVPVYAIINADDLDYKTVAGKKVLCPNCEAHVFAKWPAGWGSHSKSKCDGLEAATASGRKSEFKKRYKHLFK